MNLMKYEPTSLFNEPFFGIRPFRDDLSKLFDFNLEPMTAAWKPKVDLWEQDDKVIVEAECAGLGKDDLDISVEGKTLTIQGEKRNQSEYAKNGYQYMERSFGTFKRSFGLPSVVNPETIQATYKNGVVRIEMEKREEYKPKKIEIKELTEGEG